MRNSPCRQKKMIPFLLVTISKLELTKFQDHLEKGPRTSETHPKGSFPEKGKVHRYSLSERTASVPKWWQMTLALPSRLSKPSEQGWPQKQQVSVSQRFL